MKKSLSLFISKLITSLFLICLPITFLLSMQSCSVGLGDAVDTQVPTLSIQTPPVDAIIRDKFAVGGTWSDDGEIQEVKVVLKRNDSQSALIDNVARDGEKHSFVVFDGSVVQDKQGKGTWSSVIDPFAEGKRIKDGKYEIQVTITDTAGHSTIQTRLITIDNTAPVIVLDRPASREGSQSITIDGYGQKLSILGRAADDNSVDSLEINFFKENDENPIHTITKTGVSNTIDETIAVFGDENYSKIYGTNKNGGTVNYRCTINAYDKAQKYSEVYPIVSEQSKEDKLGNKINHYYLYSELNNKENNTHILQQYTITQLYKILSDNYVPSESKSVVTEGKLFTIEEVESLLNGKLKVNKGQFTLNPQNNPTYELSGYKTVVKSDIAKGSVITEDEILKAESDLKIQNNSRLSIDIAPGNDNNPLKNTFDKNYKVEVYPFDIRSFEVIKNKEPYIIEIKNFSDKPEDQNPKFQGGSYKLIVPLTQKDIPEYGWYEFRITGKDMVGNDLMPIGGINSKYIFNFTPSGIPPVVNVIDDVSNYYNATDNNTLIIHGTIKSLDAIPSLLIRMDDFSDTLTISEDKDRKNYLVREGEDYIFRYELNLPSIENLSEGNKKITIVADCGNSLKSEPQYLSFKYDSIAPIALTYEALKPDYVDSLTNNKWYKSSQVKVKVTIPEIKDSDSGIESVEAGIDNGDKVNEYVTLTRREDKEKGIYFDGYITAPNENGKNTIKFRLTDKAGNIGEYNMKEGVKEIYSTDVYIDTLAPLSFESNFKETTKLVNGQHPLTFNITNIKDNENGSGIDTISLLRIGNKQSKENIIKVTDSCASLTVQTEDFNSGAVTIKIVDKVGNEYIDTAFMMDLDNSKPSISFGTIYDADGSTTPIDINGMFTLKGTANDDKGLDRIVVSYKKEGDSNYVTIPSESIIGTNNWETTIDTSLLVNGNYIFKIQAIDKAGNLSDEVTKEVFFNQDSDRPIITLTTVDVNSVPANLKNSSLLSGMVSDDDGVKSLKYKVGSDGSFIPLKIINGAWEIKALPEGTRDIYFEIETVDGKTFTSGKLGPKIKGINSSFDDDGILSLRVDTNPPLKTNVLFASYNNISVDGYNTFGEYEKAKSSEKAKEYKKYDDVLGTVGGNHNKFKIKMEVYDENGIDTISAKLGDEQAITSYKTLRTVYKFEFDDNKLAPVFATAKENNSTYYTNAECTIEANIPLGNVPKYINDYKTVEIEVAVPKYLETRTYPLVLSVIDGAENKNESTIQISVDNTAPKIDVTRPLSTVTSSGNISVYGNVDSSSQLYYAIEASDENLPNGVTVKANPTISYNKIKDASLSWFVYFDGDTDSSLSTTHSKIMNDHLKSLYNLPQSITDYEDVTPVNFVIKAVDDVGNTSTVSHKLMIDPQGDRPTIEILGPENKATVGGTVRIYGTANDPDGSKTDKIGIKRVWLQIISENNEGHGDLGFNKNSGEVSPYIVNSKDLDYMALQGYHIYNMKKFKNEQESSMWVSGVSTLEEGEQAKDYGAIINFSGSSWSAEINKEGAFNPIQKEGETTSGSNAIRFMVYAQDLDNKLSIANDIVLLFDSDRPIISDLYLVNNDGTKSREYNDDMFISGEWKLVGKITDKDTVARVRILDSHNGVIKTYDNIDSLSYDLEYPLPNTSDGVGQLDFYIEAVDKVGVAPGGATESHTQKLHFVINYDNNAPVLAQSGTIGYNINSDVKQNNSFYTFGSKVTEDNVGGYNQSGLNAVAAYFVKRNINAASDVSDAVIYNPLIKKDNKKSLSDMVYDSGLYWIKQNIKQDSSQLDVFTVSGKLDPNIHKNSLVKINGTIYLINDISGNEITINGNPMKNDKEFEALFANAIVIDNPIQETGSGILNENGYFTKPVNDDGDGMVESCLKSGSSWNWEANINSRNIPDGPLEIHYVAFDNAGNYSIGIESNVSKDSYQGIDKEQVSTYNYNSSHPCYVSNNAPRIAGVVIKTDYNGDGKFEGNGEIINEFSITNENNFNKYSNGVLSNVSNVVFDPDKIDGGKSSLPLSMTVGEVTKGQDNGSVASLKDYTIIEPEIVGGNGNIYYGYSIEGGKSSLIGEGSGKENRILINEDKTSPKDYKVENGTINIQLGDLLALGDKDNVPFNFSFWDSTEGTIPFSSNNGSQKVDLTIYFDIKANNSVPPTGEIYNYEIDESNDKSKVYYKANEGKKTEYKIDTNSGHLDIKETKANLSGVIEIMGTAYDTKAIDEIKININGMPGMKDGNTYKTVASSTGGVLKESPKDYKNNGYEFTIINVEGPNESGHKVEWRLKWNTSMLDTVVKINTTVKLQVLNKGNPTAPKGSEYTSIDGITQYGKTKYGQKISMDQPATYTVDVVPYITDVVTSLSSLNKRNGSVYNRTALGRYPIRTDETVIVKGFNLYSDTVTPTYTMSIGNVSCANPEINQTDGKRDGVRFKPTSASTSSITSGDLVLTVNNVPISNNDNNDKLDWNKKPNNINNNNLTDNIAFDIWEINSEAAKSKKGVLTEPVMQINPVTDMVGFAFTNGPAHFSMPGYHPKTSGWGSSTPERYTSYEDWQYNWARYINIEFVYDSLGHAHAISTGIDTAPGSNHVGRFSYFYDKWGPQLGSADENYNGTNAIRLEGIGDPAYYIDENRFNSPSLATTTHGSNVSTYLAYYDDITKQIRFRYMKNVPGSKQSTDQFEDNKKSNGYDAGKEWFTPSESAYSLIASGQGEEGAGRFVSIDAKTTKSNTADTDVVVAVWYDGTNCYYSYNTTPTDDNDNSWKGKTKIFDEAGEYCQIKFDPNGGVHIAAYDTSNANLVYAYLPSYDRAAEKKVVTVDAYNLTGTHVSLDVIKKGNIFIPYISYYNPSIQQVKMAYPIISNYSELQDGVNEYDEYNQNWEVTTIPSPKGTRIRDDNTNIAFWKNAKGEHKEGYKKAGGGNVNSATDKDGVFYGNGTANPIIGYAISKGDSYGRIETAQMK